MKEHERPVSNDWESVQLARFPDESRRKSHIPDDGGSVRRKDSSVFSILKCTDFTNNLVTVSLGPSCNLSFSVYSNPSI